MAWASISRVETSGQCSIGLGSLLKGTPQNLFLSISRVPIPSLNFLVLNTILVVLS